MIEPYDFLYEDIQNFLKDQEYLINKKSNKKVPVWWIDCGKIAIDSNTYNSKELLENFLLPNGKPCGIEIPNKNEINLDDLF